MLREGGERKRGLSDYNVTKGDTERMKQKGPEIGAFFAPSHPGIAFRSARQMTSFFFFFLFL